MGIRLYGLFYRGSPDQELSLSFVPQTPQARSVFSIHQMDGRIEEFQADTSLSWRVEVPDGAEIVPQAIFGHVLRWRQDNGQTCEASPNEVFAYSKLGLHGFTMLGQDLNEAGRAGGPR